MGRAGESLEAPSSLIGFAVGSRRLMSNVSIGEMSQSINLYQRRPFWRVQSATQNHQDTLLLSS